MGETRAVPGGCMDILAEARRILSEATMPVAKQRASVRPRMVSCRHYVGAGAARPARRGSLPPFHSVCTLLPIPSWKTPRQARLKAAVREPREPGGSDL